VVAAGADGTEHHRRRPPRALAAALPKLRRASRRASRKQPHSNNRRRADQTLNRIHGRVSDLRRYATHQVTTQLVKNHDRLCLEDLAVANLTRNHHLARSIADAAWGELARQLTYKAAWYGAELVVAPRWLPSSKTCSGCGRINQHLNLAQRTFHCDRALGGCGLVIDRDLNAAVNLAAWAEAEHPSAAQARDPQAGGRATKACGGTGTGHGAHRGETGPATPCGKKQEPLSAAQPAA
jgi:putative transposase